MKKIQFSSIILLVVLTLGSCKKVAPEEIKGSGNYIQLVSIAGSGGDLGAYADGVGEFSAFDYLTGITMDAAGNLYVNDQNNFRIRKITPAGVVSTFAGSGVNGYVDGTGTSAQFGYLEGMAMDASGNIYASDYGNNVIRKITPAGVVSTYAGNGQRGLVDGPVAIAQFSLPTALTIDNTGNMYVVDLGTNVVRKISAGGIVSSYAGVANNPNFNPSPSYNGPASSLRFGPSIYGLATDPSGNLYVCETFTNLIYKITPAGNASVYAGDGERANANRIPFRDGLATTAEFNYAFGMANDAAGNLYVADAGNNRIRKITSDGIVSTLMGNGEVGETDGKIADARLNNPKAIVVSPDGSIVYFTEYNRIRKIQTIVDTNKPKNTWNNPQSWGNPK